MDLTGLESFLAVARHGSFTLAAQERGITQPGITRHVQKLERELGAALFERHAGYVETTTAGRRLLAFAEETLRGHERLLGEVRLESEELTGELRIAASSTPGEFLVPGWVSRFTTRYPGVRPQVFIADSSEVLEELRERRWDLGFVGVRLPGRDLHYDVIGEDQVVLAVPADHPFATRSEVGLAELKGQPFLEREGGSGTQLSVRAALTHRKLPLPEYRVVMVLSTTQAIVSAVQSGYGLGLVSSLALDGRDSSRVVRVRVTELPASRPLYLVQERNRMLSPLAVMFGYWVQGKSRRALVDP